jgi:hypothetical protein
MSKLHLRRLAERKAPPEPQPTTVADVLLLASGARHSLGAALRKLGGAPRELLAALEHAQQPEPTSEPVSAPSDDQTSQVATAKALLLRELDRLRAFASMDEPLPPGPAVDVTPPPPSEPEPAPQSCCSSGATWELQSCCGGGLSRRGQPLRVIKEER